VPATVHVDNTILKALGSRASWLPPILEQHLRIAFHSYQVCHALGNYDLTPTGLLPNSASTTEMLDTQLYSLQAQIGDDWSCLSEIAFLRVQLQLYSFACGSNHSKSKSPCDLSLQTSKMLAQASLSALKMIQIACTIPDDVPLTANAHSAVAYAVFFLLKLSALPHHHLVDQAAAKNAISQGWNLLNGGSTMENDYLSRACTIIQYLSNNNERLERGGISMMVESRMSENLTFDAVWRAKERFSETIKEAKPQDYTSAELESASLRALDFQFDPLLLEDGEYGWDCLLQDNS
jgi:hypothetical protein